MGQYVLKTVPVAIHAWLRSPISYADAVTSAIRCGGDTDTVAAITGGIVGAAVGVQGIPTEWRDGMLEWPRSNSHLARLASSACQAVEGRRRVASPKVGPAVIFRNLFFALIVLLHIGRRTLPPY
jgi:hypothetical protein